MKCRVCGLNYAFYGGHICNGTILPPAEEGIPLDHPSIEIGIAIMFLESAVKNAQDCVELLKKVKEKL